MASEQEDYESDDTDDKENIVDFVYELNEGILSRQKEQSQDLNEKSAHLIRLLGVILGVYSGAFLVAAKRSLNPDSSVNFAFFVNEYIVCSILFLAAGFLYAVLAYHKTEIASGASAQYLKNEFSDGASVADAKQNINKKVPNWVSNNETEIEKDHTRLFNCKMYIFFSLSYLLLGTALVGPINNFSLLSHVGGLVLALLVSYVLYDFVRGRASEDSTTP